MIKERSSIKAFQTRHYLLLLSDDPCSVFSYFQKEKMHGLNKNDCLMYNNTEQDAYIFGWANYIPKTQKVFCFINTKRCTDMVHTIAGIMHELMHVALLLNNGKVAEKEEKMISWVERETYRIYALVCQFSSPLKQLRLVKEWGKKIRNPFFV
jgi:hypothetical protein